MAGKTQDPEWEIVPDPSDEWEIVPDAEPELKRGPAGMQIGPEGGKLVPGMVTGPAYVNPLLPNQSKETEPGPDPGLWRTGVTHLAQGGTKGFSPDIGKVAGDLVLSKPDAKFGKGVDWQPEDTTSITSEKDKAHALQEKHRTETPGDFVKQHMRNELAAGRFHNPGTAFVTQAAGEMAGDRALGAIGLPTGSSAYQGLTGGLSQFGNSNREGSLSNLVGVGAGALLPQLGTLAKKGGTALRESGERAAAKILAPSRAIADAPIREAEEALASAGAKAENRTVDIVNSARDADIKAAERSQTASRDALTEFSDAEAKAKNAAERSEADRLLKDNADSISGAQKREQGAQAAISKYETSAAKAEREAKADKLRAQGLARREVRVENKSGVKDYLAEDEAFRARAKQHLTKGTATPASRLQKQLEDLADEEAQLNASQKGALGRKTQAEYDAADKYGEQLRAKPGADLDALARLDKLDVDRAAVGERRMLEPTPEAQVAEEYAAKLKRLSERKAALEGGKATASSDPFQPLDPEEIRRVSGKLKAKALAEGDALKPRVMPMTSAQVREMAAKRVGTPGYLEQRNPLLAEKLKNPPFVNPPAVKPLPMPPEALDPAVALETAKKTAKPAFVQPPGALPMAPTLEPLTAEQARTIAMQKLADPEFATRELGAETAAKLDPNSYPGLKQAPALDADLAKGLPDYKPIQRAATYLPRKGIRQAVDMVGLGDVLKSKLPPWAESKGAYNVAKAKQSLGAGLEFLPNKLDEFMSAANEPSKAVVKGAGRMSQAAARTRYDALARYLEGEDEKGKGGGRGR